MANAIQTTTPEVASPASPRSLLPVQTGTRSAVTPPLKVSRTIIRTYGRQEGPPLAVDEFDEVSMDLVSVRVNVCTDGVARCAHVRVLS